MLGSVCCEQRHLSCHSMTKVESGVDDAVSCVYGPRYVERVSRSGHDCGSAQPGTKEEEWTSYVVITI